MPMTPATTERKNPRSEKQQSAPADAGDRLLIGDLLDALKEYLGDEETSAVYAAYLFGA